MAGFILKFFIFIAFFVNTNIKAGDVLNDTKKYNETLLIKGKIIKRN